MARSRDRSARSRSSSARVRSARARSQRPKSIGRAQGEGQQQRGRGRGQRLGLRRPTARAGRAADRPRRDRPAVEEPPQVVGQRRGVGVSPARLLLQAFQADRLQVARDVGPHAARGGTTSVDDDQLEGLDRRLAQERRPAGQRLVEDRPQGVDVGGRADALANGPRPARAPCSWACPSPGRRAVRAESSSSSLARPKSLILGMPSAVSRTLLGLRSRWMTPAWWAACDGAGQRLDQLGGLAAGHGPLGQPLGQAAPLGELEREIRPLVVLADRVDRDDVRDAGAGRRPRPRPGTARS